MNCEYCEMTTINGLACHETGCPMAWMTERRVCLWCGMKFSPKYYQQECCDESCDEEYYR